jgi:hypothetical protein
MNRGLNKADSLATIQANQKIQPVRSAIRRLAGFEPGVQVLQGTSIIGGT